MRYLFLFILGLFAFDAAFAQKDAYYLKNSGELVSTKDSADFILVIMPPDNSVDKRLYVVNEFYPDGKILLTGYSKTKTPNLEFQGTQIAFFPDGKKMRMRRFEKGQLFGDEIKYYPNGELYTIKSYQNGNILFKQFNDSTGKVLAENGNGIWEDFDKSFSEVVAKGKINKGLQQGEWYGKINDSVSVKRLFMNGELISVDRIYSYKQDTVVFKKVETAPEFRGGDNLLIQYFARSIHYSNVTRENINGQVIISFIVEKDGFLTNIKVVNSLEKSLDDEVVKALRKSPSWNPGMQNGMAVRVAYSLKLLFSLTQNSYRIEIPPVDP